jgi:hypothetical protein
MMMKSEILGWATFLGPLILAVVVVMLLGRLRGKKETRVDMSKYVLRESVLSIAETRFYQVLTEVVGTKFLILVKPRLLDLFEIGSGEGYQAAKNRISQKHVDFLLCDPITIEPILGVELDDKSHQQSDRKERDEFINNLFTHTGLKVLHIPTARSYPAEDLRDSIIAALRENGAK